VFWLVHLLPELANDIASEDKGRQIKSGGKLMAAAYIDDR